MFDLLNLAHRFQKTEVTEKRQVLMFSMMLVFYGFIVSLGFTGFFLPQLIGESDTVQFVSRLAQVLLFILLPWLAFQAANKKGDNRDNIVRFLLLSFDAHARYGLMISVLIILAGAGSALVTNLTTSFSPLHWIVLNNLLVLAYTFVISIHMYYAGKIASGAGKISNK